VNIDWKSILLFLCACMLIFLTLNLRGARQRTAQIERQWAGQNHLSAEQIELVERAIAYRDGFLGSNLDGAIQTTIQPDLDSNLEPDAESLMLFLDFDQCSSCIEDATEFFLSVPLDPSQKRLFVAGLARRDFAVFAEKHGEHCQIQPYDPGEFAAHGVSATPLMQLSRNGSVVYAYHPVYGRDQLNQAARDNFSRILTNNP
jgi:hypothetical protein